MNDLAHVFECLALSPPDPAAPGIASAAARAGGIGILDLEFAGAGADVAARMADRARWLCDQTLPDERIGLRLRPSQVGRFAGALGELEARPATLLLTRPWWQGAAPTPLVELLARLPRGWQILVEIRNLAECTGLPSEPRVHALVACGNETAGQVGDDTTFILLQKLLGHAQRPVYARGGIGLMGAAGCRAAGARGVVLDDQLLLTKESPLPEAWRGRLSSLAGHETVVLGGDFGCPCRVIDRPTFGGLARLKELQRTLSPADPAAREVFSQALDACVGFGDPAETAWPIGQAIGLAGALRARFGSTANIVRAMVRETARSVALADEHRPLAPGSPLARSHGTEFPIVQGPMTRVSDRAEFAHAVAEAGGLPLIALSLMPGDQARTLLDETRALLGERPWGVGLLGFVPAELQREQIAQVLQVRPRFALIAGGRPDQAAALEAEGIATYLHVPAASLLRSYLGQGVRRFVFEGRECGGHVGPLGSAALWESVIGALLDCAPTAAGQASEVHVLFAGGIHDACSAAYVAAMAAPLAARGIHCGVLMGTAYLFTCEAVRTGAILRAYQDVALACSDTVLIHSGVGHANRVARTVFAEHMDHVRRDLIAADRSPDAIREHIEDLTVGRLRLASKGLVRGERGELVSAGAGEQREGGIYMLGQVATLRSSVVTIRALHAEVCEGSGRQLRSAVLDLGHRVDHHRGHRATAAHDERGVAIIGIASLLPGATSPAGFWRNLLDKVSSIGEVPADRWDARLAFDADKLAADKIYAKWGGFFDGVHFDPIAHRIPPSAMYSISTAQLLALEVTRWALADAGYDKRDFDRAATAVIFGAAGNGGLLGNSLIARSMLPYVDEEPTAAKLDRLPRWTGESFPGVLTNVIAGRVANHFDLGGPNYCIDAACASSLIAIELAVAELTSGRSNLAIAGGVDTDQTPFTYTSFSKTQALSPRGRARVFDKAADGIVISEGVCVLVLKRIAEALSDGDRVYAVIKGTGGSSDGKGLGLTVPKAEGQRRAIGRALQEAGITADAIELYEAHGTGTPLGDRIELDSLTGLLSKAGAAPQSCTTGSLKSLIGHTKTNAGAAGVAKVAMALYHRTLPPHGGAEVPLDPLVDPASPVAVLDEARPWIARAGQPHRAAVSAFGFGGVNSSAVLEAVDDALEDPPLGAAEWPAELLVFAARDEAELLSAVERLTSDLEAGAAPKLAELALGCAMRAEAVPPGPRLAVVADRTARLPELLRTAAAIVRGEAPNRPGDMIYQRAAGEQRPGVAFLFPGQGSQYVNMNREPALYFAETRRALESASRVLAGCYPRPLDAYLYPHAAFSTERADQQAAEITHTHRAQPAIAAVSVGLCDLLARLGVVPDMVAGHSFGELTALHAGGVISRSELFELAEARGRAMAACREGAMASVAAPRDQVARIIAPIPGVVIANHNMPQQTVISGDRAALDVAAAALVQAGIRPPARLPVAGAFHSPLMGEAAAGFGAIIDGLRVRHPRLPVYSNLDGSPYPQEPDAIRERLRSHLTRPVEFVAQIERMHEHGARVFVEVGPGSVLSGLVSRILDDKPHAAIAVDPQRGRLRGLLLAAGTLWVRGVASSVGRIFEDRRLTPAPLDELVARTRPPAPAATAWWVNGSTSRPLSAPPRVRAQTPLLTLETRAAAAPVAAPPPPSPSLPLAATPAARDGLPLPPASDARVSAYLAYQETMRRFLRVEEEALALFLGSSATPSSVAPIASPATSSNGSHHRPNGSHHGPNGVHHGLALIPGRIAAAVPHEPAVPAAPMRPTAPVTQASLAIHEPGRGVANGAAVTVKAALDTHAGRATRDDLERGLLAVVSEVTGYPAGLLGLDADLESELGVDSIRRVEIAGAFVERLPAGVALAARQEMEALTRARTLRRILDLVDVSRAPPGEVVPGVAAAGAAPGSMAGVAASVVADARAAARSPHADACPRYVPRARPQPLGEPIAALGGTVIVTEDALGVAPLVEARLRERGCEVFRVDRATLADPEALRLAVSGLRPDVDRRVHVVHLAPLAPASATGSLADFRRSTQVEAKALFQILNRLAPALDQAAPRVVAATGMGGAYGRTRSGPFAPAGGAVVGLLKSLAREWPALVARTVDFDLGEPGPGVIADGVVDELMHGAGVGAIEVGHAAGVRTVFESALAPRATRGEPLVLGEGAIILATGGARGITFEAVRALARPGMRVVLAGTTESDGAYDREPAELVGLDAAALQRHHVAEAQRLGRPILPVHIDAAVRSQLARREIRDNCARLAAAGVDVTYRRCDVRDEAAVRALCDEAYARYGRIDAVIHGAGITEDRLLADKDWSSFDRVFDTKADGAFLLAEHLRPATLKLFVCFGSVSGRWGNRGQTDYAAANELLNRFVWLLCDRWPGVRSLCVNWGPWASSGMATPAVRALLQAQGIRDIDPADGAAFLVDEIRFGNAVEAEVIAGQGPWGQPPEPALSMGQANTEEQP